MIKFQIAILHAMCEASKTTLADTIATLINSIIQPMEWHWKIIWIRNEYDDISKFDSQIGGNGDLK